MLKFRLFSIFNSRYNLLYISNVSSWARLFSVSVAVVTSLIVFSIFAFIILAKILDPLNYANSNNINIYIVGNSDDEVLANKAVVVKKVLSNYKNVSSFEILNRKEVLEIISKWLPSSLNIDINMPIVFNVQVKENKLSKKELQAEINQNVEGVFVESEKESLEALAKPMVIANYFNFLIPIVAICIGCIIIVFLIIAVLLSHRSTLDILFSLGAYSDSVAMDFTKWIFLKHLMGLFLGLIFSYIIILIFAFSSHFLYYDILIKTLKYSSFFCILNMSIAFLFSYFFSKKFLQGMV